MYIDEMTASIGAETTDPMLLRAAWGRTKQTWQFSWWPTVRAVLDAIREERKLRPAPMLPPVNPAAVRAREIDGRRRLVFASDVGRQLIDADLGTILEDSFIAKDVVKDPADVTDRVIVECDRIRGRYLAAVEDAKRRAADGDDLARHCVGLARAMDERNEKLKARWLPGYVAKVFPPLPPPANPKRAPGSDWTKRANWVPRPPARAEDEVIENIGN